MASLNRVEIIGRLGQDPEQRSMPNGTAVTNVSIATSERWKDKQTGEDQERTEWHRVVFFGRLAEVCAQYLRKGSQAFVAGSLRTRKWQDRDGVDRYTTEVVARELVMLGGTRREQAGGQSPSPAPAPAPSGREPMDYQPTQADRDFDDSIPF